MVTNIFGFLFSDKVRGATTGILLITILLTTIGNWMFPKQSGVSGETLDTLKELSEQIKETTDVLSTQSEMTMDLNQKLVRQLEDMERNRNDNYKQLIDKYGGQWNTIDPSSIDFRNFLDNPDGIDSLFEEHNLRRSGDVFERPEVEGGDRDLPTSDTVEQTTPNSSSSEPTETN